MVVQKKVNELIYEKKLSNFKNPKMACSKLVKFKKKLSKSFSFYKLTTRKIFDQKEIFFLFYVAKPPNSFEVISALKIGTFCCQIEIFYLYYNFYLDT